MIKFAGGFSGEPDNDLVREIEQAFRAQAEQHKNPVGDFKPRGGDGGQGDRRRDRARRWNRRPEGHAREDAAAFRDWIRWRLRASGRPAKRRGGFMGFHAERVSQGEKDMLAQIEGAPHALDQWRRTRLSAG